LTPRNSDATKCVQDIKKISAGQFYVYRVPIKLGKVIKSEKKKKSIGGLHAVLYEISHL